MAADVRWLIKMVFVYVLLCVALFFMLRTSLTYLDFKTDTEFLAFKQAVVGNRIWRAAFYIHVFSAFVALLAGFTQFSREFLTEHRRLHRLFGYLYVVIILGVNAPAGLIMAIYANGGWPSRAAFVLLDSLWFWFTLRALLSARLRDFDRHRDFMIRSFALTLSAITLRSWKIVFLKTTQWTEAEIYMVDAWMGFVPNLLVAEWIINGGKASIPRPTSRAGRGKNRQEI